MRSKQDKQAYYGEVFCLPMNAPPEFFAVLARALWKAPNHKLALLPAGEAGIEAAGKMKTAKGELTEYRITGLGFSPSAIWLDGNGVASSISSWFSIVPDGTEG